MTVFNLDKLNNNNDPINGGDGFFDYVPGLTIDPQTGNIIFTTVEPFGQHLFDEFKVDWEEGDRDNIKHSLQIPALSYYKSHQEDLQKLSSSIHSSKINQSLLANLVDHAILLKKRIGRF